MKKKLLTLLLTGCMLFAMSVTTFAGSTTPVTAETDVEDVDNNGTAKTADLIAVNKPVTGVIWNPYTDSGAYTQVEDQDWYVATITEKGYAQVNFSYEIGTGEVHSGWSVNLYIDDTSTLYYRFGGGDARIEAPASSCIIPGQVGSKIYIQVSAGHPNKYASSTPSNVPYTITVDNVIAGEWEQENNGSIETATPISLDREYKGNIHTDNKYGMGTLTGDEDYFKLIIPESGHYTVYMKPVDEKITDINGGWGIHAYSANNDNKMMKFIGGSNTPKFSLTCDTSPEIGLTQGDTIYFSVFTGNRYTNGVPSNIDYTFKVVKTNNHALSTEKVKATKTTNGSLVKTCSVCGQEVVNETIYSPKTVKLSFKSVAYDGTAQRPKVVIYDSEGKVISAQYYTVSYKNNKKVGFGSLSVKLKNKYSGTYKKTFKIVPQATNVVNVKGMSKAIKITWKKRTTQTTGYQVQYSTSKKFTKKTTKSIVVENNKSRYLTIKNLKGRKTYYVRVRTYKVSAGQKFYSDWSKVKSVKTKK